MAEARGTRAAEYRMAKNQKKVPCIIDSCVGFTALKMYMLNGNMEVGQVTVRHMVFAEIISQVKQGKALGESPEKYLKTGIDVFNICFGGGAKSVRGTVEEALEYDSPVADVTYDSEGLPLVHISESVAQKVYNRARYMTLMPDVNKDGSKDWMIVEQNLLKACTDLITCGRMYQELTIDACKNMYDINIPYGDSMRFCHLYSRENSDADLNIVCDWKKKATEAPTIDGASRMAIMGRKNERKGRADSIQGGWKYQDNVKYVMDDSKTHIEPKFTLNGIEYHIHVNDFMRRLQSDLLFQGIDFADDLMGIEQDFKDEWKQEIEDALASKKRVSDTKQIADFFHDAYKTANSYQTAALKKAEEDYPDRSVGLEEHQHSIKEDTRRMIDGISNQIRLEAHKLGCTEEETMLAVLGSNFEDGANAAYAHRILPESFVHYVLDRYAGDDSVPKYTEDDLRYCGIPEGTEVEFHDGIARVQLGEHGPMMEAYAKDAPLEGRFIIRKNKQGKTVASMPIASLVKEPDLKRDQLVFMTQTKKGSPYTSAHVEDIIKEVKGKEIQFAPFIPGSSKVHDAFFLDNKEMGKFRCSLTNTDLKNAVSRALNGIYMNKKGVVTDMVSSYQGAEVGHAAIGIVTDVKTAAPLKEKDVVMIQKGADKPAKSSTKKNNTVFHSPMLDILRKAAGAEEAMA